jgi:hypothetical protein
MLICGRHFSESTIEGIRQAIAAEPSISQLELSRRVCQWLDWRSPNGRLQDMSCRKALSRLESLGLVDLPRKDALYGFESTRADLPQVEVARIRCSLQELGEVQVYPVSSRYCKESKIWFSLMKQYHYLNGGPLCGAQIRYLVKSSAHGYLGALAFSSATWALKDRDEHIGWTEAARRANLDRVVGNDRFLILPTVEVANLASHVLSKALARLPEDWQQRYNVRPVLVETFVDPARFDGACYKAANWREVGQTSGRRDGVKKNIFLYPLGSDWRQVLCRHEPMRLGQMPAPEAPASWAEAEFGTARFYDNRLKQRLYTIAQDFYGAPQANIPEACADQAKTVGAYRFFRNPKVTMDVLIDAHTEATIERIREHPLVLAPQDTTTLDYSTHPMTEDLGPVCHVQETCVGLILHDTVAFTEKGTPLGVLDAQCWARDPEDRNKSDRRRSLPIEQKESMKWLRSYQRVAEIQRLCPGTRLVSIGDRESDIYELFDLARTTEGGAGLLVRAEKSRNRKTEQGLLWHRMEQEQVAGCAKIHVPRSGVRPARDTWVDIRYAPVQLQRPKKNHVSLPQIPVWAVYVVEKPEKGVKDPIEWMLLTTEAVNGLEDACRRMQWYSGRWGIEVYHRTLKSGCRIKDRQLGTADRLEACLGVDMVVAWRIYHLTMLGREAPELPCTVYFKDIEWEALCIFYTKNPEPPKSPPSLKEAIDMVGAIGGHLGRKADGPPGTQVLWRGIQRLDAATQMYAIIVHKENYPPMRAGP